MRNRQFLGIFLLFLMTGLVYASQAKNSDSLAAPRDPYKYFFDETWGDFQEELKNAKAQGKQGVMLFFEMDECPFCHFMKKNILNQVKVQKFYHKNFLMFPVDIEGDLEIKNFKGKSKTQKEFSFREHRVRATPVIAFFDLTGKRVFRYTGKASGVDEFLLMGEYVKNKIYKKMSFTRYKRQQRKKK